MPSATFGDLANLVGKWEKLGPHSYLREQKRAQLGREREKNITGNRQDQLIMDVKFGKDSYDSFLQLSRVIDPDLTAGYQRHSH